VKLGDKYVYTSQRDAKRQKLQALFNFEDLKYHKQTAVISESKGQRLKTRSQVSQHTDGIGVVSWSSYFIVFE